MKRVNLFLLMATVIFLFATCQKSSDEVYSDEEAALKSALGERMVPFRAVFESHGADDQFATQCSDPESASSLWLLDHQIGEGTGLHLGNFTFDMHFCFHLVLDSNGGFDFENGFGEVKDGYGYFEAANGDTLFIIAPVASVLPVENQDLFYFDDIFYFDGGTGRFEGAHGEFQAKGTLPPGGPTEHVWEGTLILPNAVKLLD